MCRGTGTWIGCGWPCVACAVIHPACPELRVHSQDDLAAEANSNRLNVFLPHVSCMLQGRLIGAKGEREAPSHHRSSDYPLTQATLHIYGIHKTQLFSYVPIHQILRRSNSLRIARGPPQDNESVYVQLVSRLPLCNC
jgi:hypothetical protein